MEGGGGVGGSTWVRVQDQLLTCVSRLLLVVVVVLVAVDVRCAGVSFASIPTAPFAQSHRNDPEHLHDELSLCLTPPHSEKGSSAISLVSSRFPYVVRTSCRATFLARAHTRPF